MSQAEYCPSAGARKNVYAETQGKKGFQTMPTVSVLTPVYNTNHEHLRQCIESILNQIYRF